MASTSAKRIVGSCKLHPSPDGASSDSPFPWRTRVPRRLASHLDADRYAFQLVASGHDGGAATQDGIARVPSMVARPAAGTAADFREASLPGADPAAALEGTGRAPGTGD